MISIIVTLLVISIVLNIAQYITTRDLSKHIKSLELELPKVGKVNIPKCQFCGNDLGKVVRRPDGYWCCPSCSTKVFNTVLA